MKQKNKTVTPEGFTNDAKSNSNNSVTASRQNSIKDGPKLILNNQDNKNQTVNAMRMVLVSNLNIDPMKSSQIPDIKSLIE